MLLKVAVGSLVKPAHCGFSFARCVRKTVARRDRCTKRQADDCDWTGIASALIPGTQSNKVT
eukprot:scaffold2004_cov107-Isochrysis_galbana.AAC.8